LTPEDLAKRWSHFRLDKGDVLLSTSASLGRVAEVDEEAVGAIPYTGIIRFKPRPGRTERCYVRHHLASSTFQEEVEALGVGSVLRHFGPTHLKRVRLLLPPIAIQQRFSDLVSPLDEAVRQRICESSNLLKLRDSLLRKLISGELRIPEAEKLAEAKA
jgi:type I restriction enzyme S subunit